MRGPNIDDVHIRVFHKFFIGAVGRTLWRLRWGHNFGDEFLGGGNRRGGCHGGNDMPEVRHFACSGIDQDIFGESTNNATGGCKKDTG